MSYSAGDRLGPYEIRARLGSGGMGVVYRARDERLGRDVAIKILSAKGATDPDRLRRFEQEARAASALDHPNIITIHEIGETDDGQPYLVMQLVEGQSLREVISNRPRLDETLGIAIQIADGLARAHRQGIVHRDLKPDNIMVTSDGLVKILDFGLAKLTEPAIGSELQTIDRDKPQTQEGKIVGTAQYMSPEQAQAESVDARSDIFSFGAILYEMVTGRRAFRGDNAVAVLADIVGRDPERLNAIDPSLPVDLDKIVRRALRKDPGRRFQHVDDMKVALEELAEELESGDALTASDVRAVAAKRKRRWPLVVGASLAIGAVAIILSMRSRDLPPMEVVPLTFDAGDENEPALSPDGRSLAYVKDGHVYVQLIGEGEAVQLTSGGDDCGPAWSPDGDRIAFLRHGEIRTQHTVLEVPAVGGSAKTLGQADGQGHVMSYSPDGLQLVISHREPGQPNALYLLSRETGDYTRLTSPPPRPDGKRVHDRFPRFSSDGRYIAFMRVDGSIAGAGHVLLYDLQTGDERVLDSEPGMLRGLDFTPDGEHVVYSVGQSFDTFHLAVTSIRGGGSRPMLPGERALRPSLSRLGNRLAYVRDLLDHNIWRVPGPAAEISSSPELIVGSTWHDIEPALSPDGTKLAFTSGRSGGYEIWIADADGSNPKKLTDLGHAVSPRWSPDGTRIAFSSVALTDSIFDVFVIDADGGFPKNLTPDSYRDLFPNWSADGRYVYYESDREDFREIWRVSPDGGEPELLVPQAHYPKISADGELFFARRRMLSRWRGPDAESAELMQHGGWANWFPWRDLIVFENGRDDVMLEKLEQEVRSIDVFDAVSGTTKTLWTLEDGLDINHVTVSPDGRWVYYAQADTTGTDIMLVENFDP